MNRDRLTMRRLGKWSLENWAMIVLMLILSLVLVRTAWISDDGFISITSAANLAEGKGFTFQPYERVQAFSNPLWTCFWQEHTALPEKPGSLACPRP